MIGKEPKAATAKRSGPGLGHSVTSSRCKRPECRVPSVGVIVGLASEARCLGSCIGLRVACSGADAARSRTLATGLANSGCDALVSFGLAGGLDPGLRSGALCLPEAVRTPTGTSLAVDAAWRRRLISHLGGAGDAQAPLVLGQNEPVASAEEKQRLFACTGAAAIDMESHAMAEVAADRAIPFLVIRAIADPAARRLPRWLGGVIGEDGRPRARVLLAGLAANPGDLAALIRLAGDARLGLATLRRVAARAGPLLAFAV